MSSSVCLQKGMDAFLLSDSGRVFGATDMMKLKEVK